MRPSENQDKDVRLAGDACDTTLYWRWLATATQAHEAGVDVKFALSTSGVPQADADAIATGIEAYFNGLSKRAWKPANDAGLPDHAHALRMEPANSGGPPRRPGIPRWCLCTIAVVAMTAVVLALKPPLTKSNGANQSTIESQSTRPDVEKPRATDLGIVEQDVRRASLSHVPHSASAPPSGDASHLVTKEAKATGHTRLPQAPRISLSSIEVPSVASNSGLIQISPGTCPPGVDRLGCPAPRASASRNSCPTGFRVSGQRCEKVDVPPHAHLEPTGLDWACDAGYLEAGARCVKLEVPAHAHLDVTGRAWQCDEGFVLGGNGCIQFAQN